MCVYSIEKKEDEKKSTATATATAPLAVIVVVVVTPFVPNQMSFRLSLFLSFFPVSRSLI